MENKVYRFKKHDRVIKNSSIISIVSKNKLPTIKIHKLKRSNLENITIHTGNQSVHHLKNHKIFKFKSNLSLTPKRKMKNTKSDYKINFMNLKPKIKHINNRYLTRDFDDFDDVDEINTIKTPDDSMHSTKRHFFKELIPSYQEFIGGYHEKIDVKQKYERLLSYGCNESTRCGSKPSIFISNEKYS